MDDVRLPLFLDLRGKRVLVVGGGDVATRRGSRLVQAGADLSVVAPDVSDELAQTAHDVQRRGFEAVDVEGNWLVLACTNDMHVNLAVAEAAESAGIWCVRADDAEQSAAWLPPARARDRTITVCHGRA